jgi:NADH:ubiquinone oxidoreductase subunit B-like Fe-S oxidoreductase
MPVDVSVPGCTCRPEALIDAVGLATEKWRRTRSEEEEMYTGPKPYHVVRP